MHTMQFENISAEKWAAIKVKLAEELNLKISSDMGHGDNHGISFSWGYNPATEILVINILSVNWIVKAAGYDEEKVLAQFSGWIQEVNVPEQPEGVVTGEADA